MTARSVLVALMLVAAACSGSSDDAAVAPAPTIGSEASSTVPDESSTVPEDTNSTTTSIIDSPTQRCVSEEAGYEVAYPADWSTDMGTVAPTCSIFNPTPFEIVAGTDEIDLAIYLKVDDAPFDAVIPPEEKVEIARELSRTETTVAGRRAVRLEAITTEEVLIPTGTETYTYLVDLGGRTLIGVTYGLEELDYETNKDVLDRMMGSLELSGG